MNHIKDLYDKEAELLRQQAQILSRAQTALRQNNGQQDCIYETLAHIEREADGPQLLPVQVDVARLHVREFLLRSS